MKRGISLVESMVALAVVGVAVLAVVNTIVAGQKQAHEGVLGMRAARLAEELMEEVLALPYDDPEGDTAFGPDNGEAARADFDNIDDFHGFTESAGALADFSAASYDDAYQGFSRAVTVTASTQNVPGFAETIDGLLVTVTVTDDRGQNWTVVRFVPEPAE